MTLDGIIYDHSWAYISFLPATCSWSRLFRMADHCSHRFLLFEGACPLSRLPPLGAH